MKKGTNNIFTFSAILFEVKNQISYNLKVLSPLQNRDGGVNQTLPGTVLCAPYYTCYSFGPPNTLVIAGIIIPISQM